MAGHELLQVRGDAEGILADHLADVVEPALGRLHPRRGALQAVGGADVEAEEAVDVADQRLLVEVRGEQFGMTRRRATVTGDIEVPAVLRGDDADVLAAGLRALAGAAGDTHLELVRTAQAAVAQLQVHGETDRILLAVAAPVGTHAALHRAQ